MSPMSTRAEVSSSLSQTRDDEEMSFLNSSCPYAKATDESDPCASSLPGLAELRQCPAFSKECPFKSATNREEVAEQLKRIPVGHLATDGPLFMSLKYFHEANKTASGDCPVRELVSVPKEWTFHRKVEELSLVSIMAEEMALTIEQDDLSSGETDGNAGTVSLTNIDDSSTISPIPSDEGKSTSTEKRYSLSDALKNGTASAHKAAESVHFVKNFIRGKIDRELYALMVAQLYHIYGNLEQALNRHAPTHFASCHFPRELHRRAALQEDIEFWHTDEPGISAATQDYIDRIQYLSENQPLLLLAHAYTRYLGDLSGGKVLARVAKRALHLTGKNDDDGLAFYQFPEVESYKLFKDKYRAALDDLSLQEEQIQDLVQEANVAFLLNMRLFEELDVSGGVSGASVRSLAQVYDTQQFIVDNESHSAGASADECPFIARQRKNQLQHTPKCPWPFTVFHDRRAFFQAWQTWFVIGLLLLSVYSSAISSMNVSS